ncbi:MAG: hypothetical protein IPP77_01065 [Bacteroidetes bacterium]|nr:hypothetical protein [Bacteroidota bacterium]
MALWVILAIILLGLVLIFLEIFLIPGTTLFGILGGVAVIVGVILIYTNYGSKWGNISVLVSVVFVAAAIFGGFKLIESNKMAMKAEITGKVNELNQNEFQLGEKGTTVSELRPNGKAVINGNKTEVYSLGDYIARGTEIEITKITHDKIFVKPLNT